MLEYGRSTAIYWTTLQSAPFFASLFGSKQSRSGCLKVPLTAQDLLSFVSGMPLSL